MTEDNCKENGFDFHMMPSYRILEERSTHETTLDPTAMFLLLLLDHLFLEICRDEFPRTGKTSAEGLVTFGGISVKELLTRALRRVSGGSRESFRC